METKDIEAKIKEYENFIEEKLKTDLKEIHDILQDKTAKYDEWQTLKDVLKSLNEFDEKDRDMHVNLELNHGLRTFAEITDYNRVYVDIGLTCLLEMDNEEADKYATIRMNLLKKQIEYFQKIAIDVKVNIKLVLLGIQELQSTLKQ